MITIGYRIYGKQILIDNHFLAPSPKTNNQKHKVQKQDKQQNRKSSQALWHCGSGQDKDDWDIREDNVGGGSIVKTVKDKRIKE